MDVKTLLKERDFTREFCQNLIDEYGGIGAAARAVQPMCYSERYCKIVDSHKTILKWISKGLGRRRGLEIADPAEVDRVNRVAELFQKAGINPDNVGAIKGVRVKSWGYAVKGPDGLPIEGGLHATDVTLDPHPPDFPLVTPAPTTTIAFVAPPRILRKTRTVPIISDIQAGFLRDAKTDRLEPIHDPLALDVAYQIVADLAPDEIVFIGDVADLPMFSRWQQYPEYQRTLQPAVNVVHEILGTFVSAAGARCTRRILIGSNHDHRIEKAVLEWNKEALNVRRAGDVEGWPIFSLGYLARFDDLGLSWSGQYPGGEYFILDDLAVMHAPPKSKEFNGSVIHGHTHSRKLSTYVQHARDGRRLVRYVLDSGCLCQTGSTTDLQRLLVTRTPSDRGRTDWVQGIAVTNIVESKFPVHTTDSIEIITTLDGGRMAIYQGQPYRSRLYAPNAPGAGAAA